ncbi:DDE_Tnp_IS1595 domain-containing protein [Trichonephila clavata]|uniref:DDE_Tnp_IS1595 domain-containing protein n=1 Tax=Trichonephila clavata TaxID=2740835 RepID=A0A8X6FE22_TRICU|nr:DDE_Tnp_IS1595 domain-containing protein [Trichonephila clavata]
MRADWRRFINEVILDHFEESTEAIGGVGKILEIDESKFGKKKYRVEGRWIFGGVERGSGKLFFLAVHDQTKETLLALIKEWIRPRATIYSDCWKPYDCLAGENYVHLMVNRSYCFVDHVTQCLTNT